MIKVLQLAELSEGLKTPGHAPCDLPALLFRSTKESPNCCCFPLKPLNFHLALQDTALLCFLGYFQVGSWPHQPFPCCPAATTLLPCLWEGPVLTHIFGTKSLYFRICRDLLHFKAASPW